MLQSLQGVSVHLACGSTDLRKSIDALAALVTHQFHLDVFGQDLFVFCNRERDKLKILYWDHSGFWLYYRRLERGHFRWPASGSEPTRCVSPRQLHWLLDGLELQQKQAHDAVTARLAS
jgi:transposase